MAGKYLGNMSTLQANRVLITTTASITTASVVLAQANASRMGFIIWNNSANSIYIVFGPTANSSTCCKLIPTFASWECYGPVVYTGIISGIRNSGSGACTTYELLE